MKQLLLMLHDIFEDEVISLFYCFFASDLILKHIKLNINSNEYKFIQIDFLHIRSLSCIALKLHILDNKE